MRVLLVEDEPTAAQVLAKGLREQTYAVDVVGDGDAALFQVATVDYDAVILDVMLPGKDGFAVCKSLRSARVNTPILMLTARSQVDDKVTGLKFGADDYLCKPFDMAELLARIEALLRRAEAAASAIDLTEKTHGNLVIDLKRGFILYKDTEYSLSAQEIKLLDYFYRHVDTIISREELLNSVWGYDADITTRTIDVHVARLRQKMGDVKDIPKYIHTIRGIGYKFTPPVN